MKTTPQFVAGRGFAPALQARSVLVVEDEGLVRETIVPELEDAGFMVLEAESGEQAIDILQKTRPAVLFTDIRLLGPMDGWSLAEEARCLNPGIPVIYATGFSVEAPRMVPKSLFLRKPYRPSAVITAIKKLTEPAQG